jgi:hypothetical protein
MSEQLAQIFKARIPSVNYIFKNGKPAIFVSGKFATTNKSEIDELTEEVAAGHPHIYIDAEEATMDADLISPIDALRDKIRAELMAEMAAATNPSNDMGSTTQEPIKPASSQDIATASVGGSGEGLAARLMSLKK